MEDTSIKIKIGDRSYPMTVKSEQEDVMMKAAKLINERLKVYEANYSVKEMQDLLAMCALEFATKYLENENKRNSIDEVVGDQLEDMERFLSQYLSQY